MGLGEARGAAREGLLAMSVAVGLRVMVEMMEDELTGKVGPEARQARRTARKSVTRALLARSCSAGGG